MRDLDVKYLIDFQTYKLISNPLGIDEKNGEICVKENALRKDLGLKFATDNDGCVLFNEFEIVNERELIQKAVDEILIDINDRRGDQFKCIKKIYDEKHSVLSDDWTQHIHNIDQRNELYDEFIALEGTQEEIGTIQGFTTIQDFINEWKKKRRKTKRFH
jgi:hypothetical protein